MVEFSSQLCASNASTWEPGSDRAADAQCLERSTPPRPLAGVIAVVGCDGAGKSTLTADLLAHLQAETAVELLYLGQDSGNILRAILRIPLVGPLIGGYLQRKSKRAHAEDDKPAAPDFVTALVVYLLSRWRRRKFQRMLALNRQGLVVITDRYPQAEAPGFHFDGPGLDTTGAAKGWLPWLAARELRLYQDMASHVPAVLIRLNVDADTAHARKPDHRMSMLREKTRVLPTLTFNGARIFDLDASAPYPHVLQAALGAARTAIAPKPG
jgi:thymidylate kinase